MLEFFLEEGNRKDWLGSEEVVRVAIIAAIALPLFVLIQLTRKQPLVNLRLLKQRNFGLSSMVNLVTGARALRFGVSVAAVFGPNSKLQRDENWRNYYVVRRSPAFHYSVFTQANPAI